MALRRIPSLYSNLLKPDDYDGMAKALDRLVSDPELRRSMGSAGRRRAESSFDSRACLGRIVSVMKGESTQPAAGAMAR